MAIDFGSLYNTPGFGKQSTPTGYTSPWASLSPATQMPAGGMQMQGATQQVPAQSSTPTYPWQHIGGGGIDWEEWLRGGGLEGLLGRNKTDPGALIRLALSTGLMGWQRGQSLLNPAADVLGNTIRTGELPPGMMANIVNALRGQQSASLESIRENVAPGAANLRLQSNLYQGGESALARLFGDLYPQFLQMALQQGEFDESLWASLMGASLGERGAERQAKHLA